MRQHIDVLYQLTTDLACVVISEWLTLKDVSRLDCAYCCKASRPAFLEMLNSPHCILSKSPNSISHLYALHSWLSSRNVRCSQLICWGQSYPDNLTAYLTKYGHVVKKVLWAGCNARLVQRCIVCCPLLVSFFIDSSHIYRVTARFENRLLALGLRGCTLGRDDFHSIICFSPNVRHLDLNGCVIHEEGTITPTPGHLRLRSLDVSGAAFGATFLLALLQNSSDTLEILYCHHGTLVHDNNGCGYDQLLTHCQKLHTLSLSVNEPYDRLSDLSLLSRIKTLMVCNAHVRDAYVVQALHACAAVEHLLLDIFDACPCEFDYTGLIHLSNLRKLTIESAPDEREISTYITLNLALLNRPEIEVHFVLRLVSHDDSLFVENFL